MMKDSGPVLAFKLAFYAVVIVVTFVGSALYFKGRDTGVTNPYTGGNEPVQMNHCYKDTLGKSFCINPNNDTISR